MGVSKVKVRGRQMWRARVTDGGVTRNAYRKRRDDAVEAENEMREELARELGPEPKTKETPTFAEHWAEYMTDAAETTNKLTTLVAKRSIYEHHLRPSFGGLKIDAIRVREVDRFRAAKMKTHSPKTVNNMLTVLRNALDVAARWELIDAVPRVAWAKTAKPPFRFLDFEESARLVEAAKQEPLAYAMIVLALNTGLRLGELLALKWDAIDLKAGRLHVREAVALGVVGTPKSGRCREVPLNETALAALREHRHLRGPLVFCTDDGTMLTYDEAKGPLRRARARSGVAHLGWHALRHTFASHLVMRGVSIKAVQDLLGHATLEVTLRYAHLSPDVTRNAVLALDVGGDTGGDTRAVK